jgi:F-type H+-transporting ATPase subunit b
MNINATLFVEMIVFAGFVGLTRVYIWPPIMDVIAKRQADIAQGVEDAKQGSELLKKADATTKQMIREAKIQHKGIIDQAETAAKELLEDAKAEAKHLQAAQTLVAQAQLDKQAVMAKKGIEAESLLYMRQVLEKVMTTLPDQPQLETMNNQAIGEVHEEN